MNYQTKKTAELRKMAEVQKIENWEGLERKELILALKKDNEPIVEKKKLKKEKDKVEEPKEELKDEPKEEEPSDSGILTGIQGERVSTGSKAARMKARLDAQPKVNILIPLEGDKFGVTFPVTLNGYRMNIIKGIYVDVPKQVADVVIDSQAQSLKALEGPMRKLGNVPMRFDGNTPLSLQ